MLSTMYLVGNCTVIDGQRLDQCCSRDLLVQDRDRDLTTRDRDKTKTLGVRDQDQASETETLDIRDRDQDLQCKSCVESLTGIGEMKLHVNT